ncbi:hypothetical protein [Actinokineospora bangkokensis]|uniref:Uncharacterized protein n=1 Tax=Actinokineospora bangkokensis TaxID=1193682 RepID=A0A1Q9LJG2_9PSEU|nr:hypothetical protein [Actinokineospora bangkokensis]OLR92168.1 hypothetical protein BJP25_22820 [Actinokineospora bangkokensis]
MTDRSPLLDPLGWTRWLARDTERRKLVEPEALTALEHAVRDFPAAAFAAGVLPAPLPVEQLEKVPRAEVRETPEGTRVRFRALSAPSEVRGWLLGNGVVISMAQATVRPVFAPVPRGDSAALRLDGVLVRAFITGWEPYPAPVEVEVDAAGRSVPLPEYLARFLADRGRP